MTFLVNMITDIIQQYNKKYQNIQPRLDFQLD